MNINFILFAYYSMVYVKFMYCFEVPENRPLYYFNGIHWVTVTPRNIEKQPVVSMPINASLLLDWEKLAKLLHPSTIETTVKETTTKKPTTKYTTVKPTTSKTTKTTTRKTPKTTTRKTTRRIIHMKKSNSIGTLPIASRCFYNFCNLNTESTTKRTIKWFQIVKKITRPPTLGHKYLTNPTVPYVPRWIIEEVTMATKSKFPMKMTKNALRTTKKSTKMTKSTFRTTKTTSKVTTTTTPKTTTILVTKNPGKSNGNMTEFPRLPDNWMELMKEFMRELKSIETTTVTNSEPPRLKETTTSLKFLLAKERKKMANVEDLKNILTDGVEIDEDLVADVIEENKLLGNIKEINNQAIDAELPLSEDIKYDEGSSKYLNFVSKNKFQLQSNNLKEHLAEIRTANEKEDDNILEDGEIAGYINVFMNRYVKTEKQTTPLTCNYAIDIINDKKTSKGFLQHDDGHKRNVRIETLVENMDKHSSIPINIPRSNSDAQLLKKHRNHWKEIDIRKHLNKIKEKYSEGEKEDNLQNNSSNLNEAVTVNSVKVTKSNKTNSEDNNVKSVNHKELLLTKDVQSLFTDFVTFLMKNISSDTHKVNKPMEKVRMVPKPEKETLELTLKLNQIERLVATNRSKPIEIKRQPLLKSMTVDQLSIKDFFADKDKNSNYDDEHDNFEIDYAEDIEVTLT